MPAATEYAFTFSGVLNNSGVGPEPISGTFDFDYATDTLSNVAVSDAYANYTTPGGSSQQGSNYATYARSTVYDVYIKWTGQTPSELNIVETDNATDGENHDATGTVNAVETAACYVSGTRILTASGQVEIQELAVGDCAVTASGAHRPIKWVGHRTLEIIRHPDPEAVWPVRVRAGAFAENVPSRDLWMSPGHMVFIDGGLLAIRYLINGTTIEQERRDSVTYWHIELDSHDIILAEGLPAESYLDTGNRTAFDDGGVYMDLHPTFETLDWTHACAPLVTGGPAIEPIRTRLGERIPLAGFVTSPTHDLHIVADGQRIDAIDLGRRRFAFALPAGSETIDLVSRTFVPRYMNAKSVDGRTLGVSIGRLQVDGTDIDLAVLAATAGWHKLEGDAGQPYCWTSGRAALPAGSRVIVLDLARYSRYWIEQRDNVVGLAHREEKRFRTGG